MEQQYDIRVEEDNNPLASLRAFIDSLDLTEAHLADFLTFEIELKAQFDAARRRVLAQQLARADVDAPVVLINGRPHSRAGRNPKTYITSAGPVSVQRSIYRASPDHHCICPMELAVGLIDSLWTPHAAKLCSWATSHVTCAEAEELFGQLGGMTPSRSSLDRLPVELSRRWEKGRETFEEMIRQAEIVPWEAACVAVSLDGVMVPVRDGKRADKRNHQRQQGKMPSGPAGFREAACATVTLYDEQGNRLQSRAVARMPDKGKATLKQQLKAELLAVLEQRPDLKVVTLADGAEDNWRYFDGLLQELQPEHSEQALDFFHASEHLYEGVEQIYREDKSLVEPVWKTLREKLLECDDGVERVIRALRYQHKRYPRRKKLLKELEYFKKHRKRMDYARLKTMKLPIGSGEVEAANKTLVAVRLKRAGSRWSIQGGQAILTFRALAKSGRFEHAWSLLKRTYIARVEVPQPDLRLVSSV